ncbi:hypothetical protein ACFWY6_16190 [Streptomyces sp. NPDC059037]|uniref:hypothetical protein n=1 Tax=Streptomyces sp. NPDC059037 TaxID=3346710 RepID=UPI0036B0F0D3
MLEAEAARCQQSVRPVLRIATVLTALVCHDLVLLPDEVVLEEAVLIHYLDFL